MLLKTAKSALMAAIGGITAIGSYLLMFEVGLSYALMLVVGWLSTVTVSNMGVKVFEPWYE